jgi:hypothetical protein
MSAPGPATGGALAFLVLRFGQSFVSTVTLTARLVPRVGQSGSGYISARGPLMPTYKITGGPDGLAGISYKDQRAEPGDSVTDLPRESVKWLREQGYVELVGKDDTEPAPTEAPSDAPAADSAPTPTNTPAEAASGDSAPSDAPKES